MVIIFGRIWTRPLQINKGWNMFIGLLLAILVKHADRNKYSWELIVTLFVLITII